jgi:hypothetical protein
VAPWLEDYGLVPCRDPGFSARTEANVEAADGTLWFGSSDSAGFKAVDAACAHLKKPLLVATEGWATSEHVLEWVRDRQIRTLNVAGNRESVAPGVGARAEAFLSLVFEGSRASKRK